jgi:amino acid adenylation domain-containing protein
LLEQGAPAVAAVLGALKAGKLFVPLDSLFPPARLAYMLEDSGARLLLTSGGNRSLAEALSQGRRPSIAVDALEPDLPRTDPELPFSVDTLASVLYTSGSTGQPKGAVHSHRTLLCDTRQLTNTYHHCPDDRIGGLNSHTSVAALKRLLPALLNGAAYFPLDIKVEGAAGLPDWLEREEITICDGKRLFRQCLGALTGEDQFPHLRLLTFGGEPIYRREAELYQRYMPPRCRMVTSMGGTEIGTGFQWFLDKETEVTDEVLPIGYPAAGTEARLLDEGGREVEAGEIGEIAIKSGAVALGYWRRPELTRERFLPDPSGSGARTYLTGDVGRMRPDGCVFHLGRKDFQVKVRGYRIETAEVEAALLALGAFAEVACRVQEDRPGETRLVAYLRPVQQPVPTVSALRRALAETLPDYMIPSAFVVLESLPRTPTGKVDRRALPPPGNTRPELDTPYVAPGTPVEEVLAGIWAELLSLDRVGIHDDFLELGGDSLLAGRLLTRIHEVFQLSVPLPCFFESPTIAGLAQSLVTREAVPGSATTIARLSRQIAALSTEELQARLVDRRRQATPRMSKSGDHGH